MKIHGYARCSTTEDKQDIERQTRELTAKGAETIHKEYASGSKTDRSELMHLLESLGKGDTLAATEVSRITRSLHHLCHIVEDAENRKIRLLLGSLEVDYTNGKPDPAALAMLQVMGVFAEYERSVTVERIVSGMRHARAKGAVMGRPRKTAADVPQAVQALWPRYKAGEINKTEYAKLTGMTRPSIYKYIRLLSAESGV